MSGKLEIIEDGRNVEISVTPSAELASLSREFLEEAVKLREACASGAKMKTTANFNFAEPGGGEVVHDVDRAVRNGILHALRPFVLEKKERLYVPTHLKAFKKENRDPRAIHLADYLRDAFLLRQAPFQMSTASGLLNLEDQWRHYANAFEYHRDPDKRLVVKDAFSPLPPMAEFMFWWGVSQKANTILAIGGFAATLAGATPAFTLELPDPSTDK